MPTAKITKANVDRLTGPEEGEGDKYWWDVDLKGFGLRITPKGVRSYVLQYRMRGRPPRRLTIGQHGIFTPAQAREQAERLLLGVKQGLDPADAAKRERQEAKVTFAGFLETFRDECLKEEWPDSWDEAHRTLERHALPFFKHKPLASIDPDDIAELMRSGKLPEHKALARKVWAVLSRLFSFAVEQRRIDLAANPMKVGKPPRTTKSRTRVLTPDEIIAAWRASYSVPGPFGPFVRLLFATLQRRNEVAGLPWAELDRERAAWIIDSDRAKNDQDHLVPLNALAVAELEAIGWKRRGLVLPNSRGKQLNAFSKSKALLDAAMLPILQSMANERADALGEDREAVELPRWTIHDIRRTGSTMLQALGVPVEVADKVLNHKTEESAKGSRRAYFVWKYEAEKRDALRKWGDHLGRLLAGGSSVVVPLRKGAAS